MRNKLRLAAALLALCLAAFPGCASACTGLYAGSAVTENGSVYVGRTEDFGPDYVKHFVIVPAADHAEGEMMADDYGFCAPYPAHTLRYTAIMDDPSEYDGVAEVPFGEAGINERGVCVTATVSTAFNWRVMAADPLTENGITELSMASYILQSAQSARDGVRLLAECIDTCGHGSCDPDDPDCREVSTVLIADREETWVFEVVSGHQYVATRLADDTVAALPNVIMTQQIDVTDGNLVVSPGLIATAKAGGFYASDTADENGINVARSYSEGCDSAVCYRLYYAAHILNPALAEAMDPVPRPVSELTEKYPYASVEEAAPGPFSLQYSPAPDLAGSVSLSTLRQVWTSHGEGTAYETTSHNENAAGEYMRAIGTFRQNEEHVFELRRDGDLPLSVYAIEWLALGPLEFSAWAPYYAAAMTEVPACMTGAPCHFDPDSLYWLFNALGNAGNGAYYSTDEDGAWRGRNGEIIDPAIAEAVLARLSDPAFVADLHAYMNGLQQQIYAKAAADDAMITALAQTGDAEAVTAMANTLAAENADLLLRASAQKLAEIDELAASVWP